MSKFTLRLSDNVRQRIAQDAKDQDRSEAYIIKAILDAHYKQAPKEAKEPIAAPAKDKTAKPPQKEDKPLTRAEMFRQMTAKR